MSMLNKFRFILTSKQKKRAILVFIVIVIGAGMELIGVSAILPFVSVLLTPEVIMEHPMAKPAIVLFGIQSSEELLILLGIGLIVLYIVKNLYMIFSSFLQCDYSARIQKELSVRVLHSYMKRPYSFFLNINSSEIIRGCNEDIFSVYSILCNLFIIVVEVVNVILIGIFLICMEPVVSFAVIGVMLFVMFGIVTFFRPMMKRMGQKNMRAKQQQYKVVYQSINSIKELFVMQRQELFLEEYREATDKARISQRNYEFTCAAPDRIVEGVCVSGMIGIIVVRLIMGVEITSFIPKLGAFAMAAFKILPSVGKISSRMTAVVYNMPMLDNVYHIIKEAESVEKNSMTDQKLVAVNNSANIKKDFNDRIDIRHVLWKYENQEIPVILDANITIHKGEAIALIGSSGAGKTTLSDIILGLLKPQNGSVYMDGTDVYKIPRQWAQIVGYVPQSVFLLDGTVRQNIAFGLDTVDDCEVWDALQQAQLKSFIESLPDQLDTLVGERGIKFSGGQRQRIAIARALYHKPEVLVLDEATAALDTETETAVMESIEVLQGQITMIIVAHRLTTIRNCDRIYEIKDGMAILREKQQIFGKEGT